MFIQNHELKSTGTLTAIITGQVKTPFLPVHTSKSGTSPHTHVHVSGRDFKGPIQVFELIITNSSLGSHSAQQPC